MRRVRHSQYPARKIDKPISLYLFLLLIQWINYKKMKEGIGLKLISKETIVPFRLGELGPPGP